MMTDEEMVNKIKAGDYDREQLVNLYRNALNHDRDEIADTAIATLKELDPRFYKSQFIKPIKDNIARIANKIATAERWADWEENAVANGVKAGAEMTSGAQVAQSCFSYKVKGWKKASIFSVSQKDEESPIQYTVTAHDADAQTVDTSREAIALFKEAMIA